MAIALGLLWGDHVRLIFMPRISGDVVRARLTMPFGTPVGQTTRYLQRLRQSAETVVRRYDEKMPGGGTILRDIYTQVGGHLDRGGPAAVQQASGGHLGEVAVYLKGADLRNVSAESMASEWREQAPEIPGAEELIFSSELIELGEDINIQLAHADFDVLLPAAERLKRALGQFPGVFDVADSFEQGKPELELELKPAERTLGITAQDLASQVRSAFYGAEALRLQRGRNEVKVMVRYPLRQSLADLEGMRVKTPGGGEIPFTEAARVQVGRGYSAIRRTDRQRVINVTARADLAAANPPQILEQLEQTILRELTADYPNLRYDLAGQEEERQESMASLGRGVIVALGLIFALLAIPFGSYSQPLVVMSAIPFGIIGAVFGHLLLGYDMSLMSMMGVVALAGVVVNDSLVLTDFINRLRLKGVEIIVAVKEAGDRRLRPVLLTTTTTFFALAPMLLETSVQARFLIPMAISLAFGVLFGTLITLVLVPSLYLILADVRLRAYRLLRREAPTKGPVESL